METAEHITESYIRYVKNWTMLNLTKTELFSKLNFRNQNNYVTR
jgi:hypothetical protein